MEFAPKPAEPARRGGLLKPILIANGLLLLILGLFAFRGTDAAKALVCEPTGALYGIGFVKSLVACAEKAAVDPEETAYNDFLQCVPGQPACAQKRCGDAYLSAFVYGAHAAKVRAASARASQQACEAEAEKNNAAKIFSEFNDCMRITINVCNRSQCVDRYRYKLTTEPYASSLRQSAETRPMIASSGKEDAAYAQFNSCVAAAAACDTARCASAFASTFPNSAYVPRVLQTAENAARTCAAERPILQRTRPPTPEPTPQPDIIPWNRRRAISSSGSSIHRVRRVKPTGSPSSALCASGEFLRHTEEQRRYPARKIRLQYAVGSRRILEYTIQLQCA